MEYTRRDPALEAQIDSMQITLDSMDVRVERMDEAIRGNGRPGLVTEVALLEKRVATCEEFVLEFKSPRRWLSVGILTLFGSLAWRVLEWFLTSRAS